MDEGGRSLAGRRTGLEQEFFLVEESGLPSEPGRRVPASAARRPERKNDGVEACVAPEFVKGLVELSTPPVGNLADLEREYRKTCAWPCARPVRSGSRLYPLGTYPLPLEPAMRDGADYQVQVRTVGPERFVHAGRCAGTHLHLELPAGTVDSERGIAASAPEARAGRGHSTSTTWRRLWTRP